MCIKIGLNAMQLKGSALVMLACAHLCALQDLACAWPVQYHFFLYLPH